VRHPDRVRLFVALVPPPAAVAELVAATRDLPVSGLRPVRPQQWHLTLAFLGEVDDATRAELVVRLGRVARRHPPPELALSGGGRFAEHVLWAGVQGDRTGLRRLCDSVRAAARRCGIATDQRPYRPHLTIARGAGADLRPLTQHLHGFTGSTWAARELHLVRSRLGAGPGGTSRHEVVSSWPLG